MASFNVDYDARSWVLVPFEFPTRDGESAEEWAAGQAREWRARGLKETRKSGKLEAYFLGLVTAAQQATARVAYDTVWALVNNNPGGFILAAIALTEAGRPLDDFVRAAAARRDDEYEPATVTPMALPNLGDGARIIRYDFDENREVCVSVAYAFEPGGLSFLLTAESYNLPAMDSAYPFLEQLLTGVHISLD